MKSIMWNGFHDFAWEQLDNLSYDTDLGLIFIDVIGFHSLERVYGIQLAQQVFQRIYEELDQVTSEFARRHLIQGRSFQVWEDCFVVLVKYSSGKQQVSHLAADMVQELENRIIIHKREYSFDTDLYFRVGTEVFQRRQGDKPEDLYASFNRGFRQAKQSGGSVPFGDMMEFERILQERGIISLFQPIIDLSEGSVFGWEALSRGPRNSPLHSPERLFSTAEKQGSLFLLEQICRESGIEQFGSQLKERVEPNMREKYHLFINVHPRTIHDPKFISGQTMKMVHRNQLHPSQIIIEITEHQAIQDYPTFLESINHYRHQGYRIAIDDTGAGYAGLQTIVELMPDFIKLDMTMVRDVDKDPRKQIMGETMVNLANKLGAKIIAEGIETQEELAMMKSLGAQYGQGFFLGKPNMSLNLLSSWNQMLHMLSEPQNRPPCHNAAPSIW